MANAVPAQLTRFYGTVEYAMDVIENRNLAFIHVSLLNDPFDPYHFFETDFGDTYPALLKHVKENHSADMPWFRAQVTPESWGRTIREIREYIEKTRNALFMLSTSASLGDRHPEDNLYMWGHYGNGHRGLALQFDSAEVAKSALDHHKAISGSPLGESQIWSKVEYAPSFAPVSATDLFHFWKQEKKLETRAITSRSRTRLEEYYDRTSVIKSSVWKTENEWRLLWRNDAPGLNVYKCPISSGSLTKIFIGLNYQGDMQELAKIAKASFPMVELFQAKKRHGDFAVEFERL